VLGIADIADALGMSRSTTHRYVISLAALGFLEQGASRKYRLGVRAADPGRSAINSMSLRRLSGPLLERLRRETSHTVVIAALEGPEIICLNRVRSYKAGESLLWLDVDVGARLPAHSTAMGKLLLAQLTRSHVEELTEAMTLNGQAPKAIRSKTALLAALRDVREQGYAMSDEERSADVIELAVPLRRDGNVGAALGVLARASRVSVADFVTNVRVKAEAVADELAAQVHKHDPRF
jgi:IclR family transcriptional regulator, pca regulon regulatory protein